MGARAGQGWGWSKWPGGLGFALLWCVSNLSARRHHSPSAAQLMLPHGIGGKKAASHSRPVLPPIFTWVPCLPRCGHQDPHRLCGVGGRPWHAACEYQLLCIMGPGLAGEGGLVEAYTKIWRHHSQHTPHAALRIWRGGNSPQDRDVSWWEKGCLTPG